MQVSVQTQFGHQSKNEHVHFPKRTRSLSQNEHVHFPKRTRSLCQTDTFTLPNGHVHFAKRTRSLCQTDTFTFAPVLAGAVAKMANPSTISSKVKSVPNLKIFNLCGGGCRPVAALVFKISGRLRAAGVGGFDSHPLPFPASGCNARLNRLRQRERGRRCNLLPLCVWVKGRPGFADVG